MEEPANSLLFQSVFHFSRMENPLSNNLLEKWILNGCQIRGRTVPRKRSFNMTAWKMMENAVLTCGLMRQPARDQNQPVPVLPS
jgi:hypothetical protein